MVVFLGILGVAFVFEIGRETASTRPAISRASVILSTRAATRPSASTRPLILRAWLRTGAQAPTQQSESTNVFKRIACARYPLGRHWIENRQTWHPKLSTVNDRVRRCVLLLKPTNVVEGREQCEADSIDYTLDEACDPGALNHDVDKKQCESLSGIRGTI
mgnify:CR=1 FL=1